MPDDATAIPNRVFVSYSSSDRPFALRLLRDLERDGIDAWFDDDDLGVGHRLSQGLATGVGSSGWLVVLLSPRSVESKWVLHEIGLGLEAETRHERPFVLPAKIETCELPAILGDRVCANFVESYDKGYAQLMRALAPDLPILLPTHPLWSQRPDSQSLAQYLRRTHVPLRIGRVAKALGFTMLDDTDFRFSCNEESILLLAGACEHAGARSIAELDEALRSVEARSDRMLERLYMEDEHRRVDIPFLVHLVLILARREAFTFEYLHERERWNGAVADRFLRIVDDVIRLPLSEPMTAPRTRSWRFLHRRLRPIAYDSHFTSHYDPFEQGILDRMWDETTDDVPDSSAFAHPIRTEARLPTGESLVLVELPLPSLDGEPWQLAILRRDHARPLMPNRIFTLERRIESTGDPGTILREWCDDDRHLDWRILGPAPSFEPAMEAILSLESRALQVLTGSDDAGTTAAIEGNVPLGALVERVREALAQHHRFPATPPPSHTMRGSIVSADVGYHLWKPGRDDPDWMTSLRDAVRELAASLPKRGIGVDWDH